MTDKNEENSTFDLEIVYTQFNEALCDEEDVKLQEYLRSYEELDKFFALMGTIFSFVSSDLRAKVETLKDFLRNEETAPHYSTVKCMIEYEKNNNLLKKKGFNSGSRTLLRLHRGLDFIKLFLQKLGELKNEDHTSHSCREAYDLTLAKHHPFIIKNGARVAMYALPTREQLLIRVCGSEDRIKHALDLLPQTLETTGMVYNRIENLFALNDLLSLP